MDSNIRAAGPQDVNKIAELILELAHFEKAPGEVIADEQTLLRNGFSENPLFLAWVAEIDDEIVGMALCYVRYSTWKGPVLYLEDLIVTKSFRGRGLGKKLFETCLNFAKSQGYPRMLWQVLDWNQPAIDFYEAYGANFEAEWLNGYVDLPVSK